MSEPTQKKILHLTLYRRWFDDIAAGRKGKEYRDNTTYWRKRIINRDYDEVHFTNGYGKHRPFMRVQYLGWSIHADNPDTIELDLGRILETRNYSS